MIKDKGFTGARLGFIGVGNMGGALVRAARRRMEGAQLLLANRTEAKAAALAKELGMTVIVTDHHDIQRSEEEKDILPPADR